MEEVICMLFLCINQRILKFVISCENTMYGEHSGRRRVHAISAGCAALPEVCALCAAKLLWKERAESLEMLCQAHGGWKDNASLQRQVICAEPTTKACQKFT